ncbi:hypothetical protein DACRYDRAFT_20373 [Dacryopinax primogenitus]|uniref:Uncharacterized protein n=1 Tax=Dacryopinax primogenitus (strain DJM 731) TaxID=1858805 RepID=M5G7L7_DACPD|nr:uncharacterized protein DACRYDRAFT_20373 [Dacryopinax primogenitus]EJU04729.1 hypothetical protein DACRYDRAFT_20373 [Dacryopinax primogenitus]
MENVESRLFFETSSRCAPAETHGYRHDRHSILVSILLVLLYQPCNPSHSEACMCETRADSSRVTWSTSGSVRTRSLLICDVGMQVCVAFIYANAVIGCSSMSPKAIRSDHGTRHVLIASITGLQLPSCAQYMKGASSITPPGTASCFSTTNPHSPSPSHAGQKQNTHPGTIHAFPTLPASNSWSQFGPCALRKSCEHRCCVAY